MLRQQAELTQLDHLLILITAALPENTGSLRMLGWIIVRRHIEGRSRPLGGVKIRVGDWGEIRIIWKWEPKKGQCRCSGCEVSYRANALLSCEAVGKQSCCDGTPNNHYARRSTLPLSPAGNLPINQVCFGLGFMSLPERRDYNCICSLQIPQPES